MKTDSFKAARCSWTVPEFAERHRLSRGTIYNEINSGELESIKIGAARRITIDAEARWLEKKSAA